MSMKQGHPGRGQVDLWYVPLDDFGADEQAACLRLLSPPERERHDAFKSESARLQHLAARGLIRTTLSGYRDIAPEHWRFGANRYGRPFIDDSLGIDDLHFSLSHTHGLVACAVAAIAEIGVDVEPRDRDAGLDELAAAVLSPRERLRFEAMNGQARRDFFFTSWTLKEAYVKARGMGLALPMKSVVLDLEALPPLAHFTDPIEDDPSRWAFRSLHLASGHIAGIATAVPGGKPEIVPRRTRAINPPARR
ncbi:4'-phosphopantetheinyl transferase superfamily protein [Mesorhizobium sp. B2-3-4]|uniref:4'-phosphopantetheinyl transferase family protein n=1 Tax=Mesorhizobium sp. B2-3-4 TaxID=2589959 RepID=UPI001AEEE520|nr:4'-phosphopantetheinyl transferase superfamily protein [Mesorhizobium sp. B2-3-4]